VEAADETQEVLMKHRMILSTLGLAALAFSVTPSQAASDPSGIWLNDVGSAKMEVKKCGKNLCAKIVWLRNPTDSRGKPLHDVRNENASMRDRPILGLPLFSNMVPAGPGVWIGNVYNPEEGRIYTEVKITLASSKTIVLKGCKAWLLCGEKAWTRSKLDTKPEPETTAPAETPEQIEVKATPKAPNAEPKAEPSEVATAKPSAEPKSEPAEIAAATPRVKEPKPNVPAKPIQASAGGAPALGDALPVADTPKPEDVMKPEFPQGHDAKQGYGFVTTSATPEPAPLFSSQSPSSMFAMTEPEPEQGQEVEAAAVEQSAAAEAMPIPLPAQKPVAKPKPKPQTAVSTGTSAPVPDETPGARPKPEATAEADTTATAAASKPKPRVEKRREDLPWLQHP
jgi:uncharacterized protein (DUF2147 family)